MQWVLHVVDDEGLLNVHASDQLITASKKMVINAFLMSFEFAYAWWVDAYVSPAAAVALVAKPPEHLQVQGWLPVLWKWDNYTWILLPGVFGYEYDEYDEKYPQIMRLNN